MNFHVNTYFDLLQFSLLTFGLIFSLRIINFKRDARFFYFLATVAGSFQFISFSHFNVNDYLCGLATYIHDLVLPLVAILIYKKANVKPRKITKENFLLASILTLFATAVILTLYYITIPTSALLSTNPFSMLSFSFGILVFVGSAMLALGFIGGLLINAIYYIQLVILSLFVMAKFDTYQLHTFMNILFNTLTFFIFLYGYKKNKKLLSHQDI